MTDARIVSAGAPLVDVSTLVEHPRNPRRGDVDAIVESIESNGFFAPVVYQQRTRHVLAGNHRLKAAARLGMSQVPAVAVDVDDLAALRILLADNRTSDLGGYDDGALASVLSELSSTATGLTGTAYDGKALEELLHGLEVEGGGAGVGDSDDNVPAVHDGAQSATGQVYELGPHRVLCGDSRDPASARSILGVEQADMVWTDPPYGVAYVGKTKEAMTIENDDLDEVALRSFLVDVLGAAVAVTKPGGCWFVASPAGPLRGVFGDVLRQLGIWRQMLVWEKDALVLGRSDYHYRHEPIFYGWRPGAAHRTLPVRDLDSILKVKRPKRSEEHPTMKPVELVKLCIERHTIPGETVLDVFGGSGTTLIASAIAGRRARLVEIDPRYVDVIRRRWTQWALEAGADPGPGALR